MIGCVEYDKDLKKIGSFDVGEKNFAYCVGDVEEIDRWCHHDVVKKKKQNITDSCLAISEILENENWLDCEEIVIEQQMRCNVRAQRVGQHIWTWFHCKYPHIPVKFVKSSLKSKYFEFPKNKNDLDLKKWAVEKARAILKTRNDEKNLRLLDEHEKRDDLADSFLQLLAHLEY